LVLLLFGTFLTSAVFVAVNLSVAIDKLGETVQAWSWLFVGRRLNRLFRFRFRVKLGRSCRIAGTVLRD
jgi:hypothetical protein